MKKKYPTFKSLKSMSLEDAWKFLKEDLTKEEFLEYKKTHKKIQEMYRTGKGTVTVTNY